jgi:ribonuclease HI
LSEELKQVTIYTDGAAVGNPGPGGYAAVLIYGSHRKELHGGFRLTTNNRMEIMAAIVALEALKAPCRVTLHSDSEYLVKAMAEGWAARWRSRDWWRTTKERAANADLWQRLLDASGQHAVEFVHVKGHAGNPENERCDQLAEATARQNDLPPDAEFEQARADGADAKVQDIREGEPCRKCGTTVVKRSPRKPPKPGQVVWYEYYMYCPNCRTTYMVEEGKREAASSDLPMNDLFGQADEDGTS